MLYALAKLLSKRIKVYLRTLELQTYHEPYTTEIITAKGGVTIFAKDNLDTFERLDLKICDKEYEGVWIEIKNKKSKNVIVGCIYRHPHSPNLDDYIAYMKACLAKLQKENKEVYITGDFNIDLLKYEINPKYQEFYNLMTSSGFLPYIILPTRITDTTMTIVDNIYSNTFSDNVLSGNILVQVADHLVQFLLTNKSIKTSKENNSYFKRDYKSFNE